MSNENNNGQVEAIERLVRAAMESETKTDQSFVIVPNGYGIKSMEEFQNRPHRVKAAPKLESVDSFIAYANRWKVEDVSTVFCNVSDRSLEAVMDDHEKQDLPSWRTHRATYTAKLSRELQFWQQRDGQELNQLQFAELLEERLVDVESPPGATLLELALNLQTHSNVTFRSAVRLSSSMVRMEYAEESGNGNIDLPEKIGLAIPLFHNGDYYKVIARLRFRVKDGKATFRYKLVDIEEKLEHAFKAIIARVTEQVPGVAIYQGTR